MFVVCATSSLCTLVYLFDCVLTHANKAVFDGLHCRLSSLIRHNHISSTAYSCCVSRCRMGPCSYSSYSLRMYGKHIHIALDKAPFFGCFFLSLLFQSQSASISYLSLEPFIWNKELQTFFLSLTKITNCQ